MRQRELERDVRTSYVGRTSERERDGRVEEAMNTRGLDGRKRGA